jgi:hypothetical protein
MLENSEETSAEWANQLQGKDTDSEARSLVTPATIAKTKRKVGTHTASKLRGANNEPPQAPAPQAVQTWIALEPTPLTRRIRERVWKKCACDAETVENLVLQVSPSRIAALTNCCLLVAYYDACPWSRATESGLVSLAYCMYRRNRSRGLGVPRISIAMYDTKAQGNQSFAADQLKASPVPKLYLIDASSRKIKVWQGKPMGDATQDPKSATEELTRTLPEEAIMDALERCMPSTP